MIVRGIIKQEVNISPLEVIQELINKELAGGYLSANNAGEPSIKYEDYRDYLYKEDTISIEKHKYIKSLYIVLKYINENKIS